MLTVMEGHKLMKSSDGGAEWFGVDNVPVNKTNANYNGYASAVSLSGSVYYAVNDANEIFISKNAAQTWAKQHYAVADAGGEWRNFVTDQTGQNFFAHTSTKFYASVDQAVTLKLVLDKTGGMSIIDIATDASAKYVYVLCLDGLYTYTRSTGAIVKNDLKMVVNQGYGAYGVATSSTGQHIILSVQPEGLYVSDDFGNTWLNIRGLTR